MTVLFLTNREDHRITSSLIRLINLSTAIQWTTSSIETTTTTSLTTKYSGWNVFGYDIENRGDFPVKENLLLSAFCKGGDEVLVVDNTSVDNSEVFSQALLKKTLFIAHNADHEARWGIATQFSPSRYGCTMVNDKRLLSGEEGYRFDLVSTINRRLGERAVPIWMDKDIRAQFATCTFFTDEHILYNASDTIRLIPLYNRQLDIAESIGQSFLHKTINSRLIIPFAQAEMTGFKHNTEKWNKIAEDRAEKAATICKELDELLVTSYSLDLTEINGQLKKEKEQQIGLKQRLEKRKEKLETQIRDYIDRGKTHLKSYEVSLRTLMTVVTNLDTVNTVDTGFVPYLNWNSPLQRITALQSIGCPLPMIKDPKTRKLSISFKKEARNMWFTDNPDSPFVPIMEKFTEYKKLIHNVNAFGEKWTQQYTNPITGRVHTMLDQAGTDTGRPSSGSKGKNKKYPNLLQIPKPKEYRECFEADPGRKMITIDYKNCEGVVMIALSGDLNMKKLTELDDQHSYLGTKCWRNVYEKRYQVTGKQEFKLLAETYEMNKSTPEKEKERDIFKNSGGLFPVAYGVAAAKVAGAAKISEVEGQVMIDTIKAEIPLVIKFLDSKSKEAVTTGYVVHNTRTGSRRGFTPILDHIHYGFPLDRSKKAEVEFAARNSPIQGTNSDLMKEAIIMVDAWARIYKQDVRFLLTVYDEGVWDVPADDAERLALTIGKFMVRAAKNYLIPEIDMGVDIRIDDHWKK